LSPVGIRRSGTQERVLDLLPMLLPWIRPNLDESHPLGDAVRGQVGPALVAVNRTSVTPLVVGFAHDEDLLLTRRASSPYLLPIHGKKATPTRPGTRDIATATSANTLAYLVRQPGWRAQVW